MDYDKLRIHLHIQLDSLIEQIRSQRPNAGMIDLQLSVLTENEDGTSTTLNGNVEIVEQVKLLESYWEVTAESLWEVTHRTIRDVP